MAKDCSGGPEPIGGLHLDRLVKPLDDDNADPSVEHLTQPTSCTAGAKPAGHPNIADVAVANPMRPQCIADDEALRLRGDAEMR